MPEQNRWTWGLEGNFIADRNLDNDQGGISGDRYFITGSYGIFQWLSFDGKIGVGSVEWDMSGSNNDMTYGTGFAGAYGFRVRLCENKNQGIKAVAGFQHISVHPEPKNQDNVKHETIIDGWQGSLVVSKKIGNFTPYAGGRYGTLDFIKWENEMDRKRIHSEDYYGIVAGLDLWLNDRTRINIEGTFLDGEEFALGISHDF